MTTTKHDPAKVEPFDFTRPGSLSSSIADAWQRWSEMLTSDFSERWMQLANTEVRVRIVEQMALSFDTVRQRLPKPAIGCGLSLGSANLPSMLVFDRPLALGMVLQMLGEPAGKLPEDRPLTSIEFSLCEVLFQKLSESISESWPDKDQLACELGSIDPIPHRSRLWDPRKMVFVCSLQLGPADDAQKCYWILPHDELEELLLQTEAGQTNNEVGSQQKMAQRVLEIKVPLTVEVGRTSVPVSRLANLAPGDVLVLDQRINEPLPLVVGERVKFHGWLGRNGNRQLFKISDVSSSFSGRKP
ncbi:MAG: FliM/FliN family flagellar motor switch protein [Pirellulaceae bacterium]|nr:hypothetical protein [Planctomycetaceae bacterium]MDG2103871.1 FliM/FliN family flagellar motor switch protein [Pirellulaceae bacterium]